MNLQDTITAPATGNVTSALGIIRMSGSDAVKIIDKIFIAKGKNKSLRPNSSFKDYAMANTLYYGTIIKPQNTTENSQSTPVKQNNIVDEVVISIFKSPHSFTGEDIVEISHHGSPYIQQSILQLLLNNGARLADKGEFSLRAFVNGKMNLSQAEAIADLIHSDSEASHNLAINQLRGGYNRELKDLRHRFLKIASLLELEIDFSAEQEVFIDRNELQEELIKTEKIISNLVHSFRQGNAFKNGIPVAIAGKPNSGKSTLMNAILKDNRSIVSSTAGTTRDTIEETITINGVNIRFIDTAGIRESDNDIEKEGIRRSLEAIAKSQIVAYLLDSTIEDIQSIQYQLEFLQQDVDLSGKKVILVVNKEDISSLSMHDREELRRMNAVFISAKNVKGIDTLLEQIVKDFNDEDFASKVFVTNVRHYEALTKALEEINTALTAVENDISSDLISENIRMAMHFLGQITGEITNEDILTNIFSSFCIGK